ncbi:MAG: Na/Pi cotransporter family protein [Oscillospiraceae bacterium]|nr:Na/Pi cotransporter family protein [Oscillospiraceae bacterium]
MSISNLITLLGGIALFLFGMGLMGDGLKKVAGSQMELILFRLSGTPLKGLLLGAGVTAVIQSSSATSVMVVGFVNSGMMKLSQALCVIHGALIGTSITGWVISLSYLGESGGLASLLSTSSIAAVFAVIGILMRMTAKKMSQKHAGDVLLGFTVLMYGLQSMSGAVAPLKESPAFLSLLTTFSHPLVGILVGAVFTAILQSASAAIGILQALSATGAIDFAVAYPIILGIAIGASVPVLLSAIGARVDGRRAAFLYLFVELAAALIFALLYYALEASVGLGWGSRVMDPFSVAAVNTIFRVLTAVLLMPFNRRFIGLSEKIIRISEAERSENAAFDRLDERFLTHPRLALEQSRLTVNDMANTAIQALRQATGLVWSYSAEGYASVERMENLVDSFEDKIGTYLVRLNTRELSALQNEDISKFLHTISDFERISDHAMNIAEVAQKMNDGKIRFSDDAEREMRVLSAAVEEILSLSIGAFEKNDIDQAYAVEPLEERVDELCDEMKLHHVNRLKEGICTLNQGFPFNDLITNFERVADHCSNIAIAMIELQQDDFDTHEYVINLRELHAHRFDEYYVTYAEKYKI